LRLLATPRARALIAAALVAIGALAAVLPLQDDAARSVPVAETGAEFERLGDLTLGEQAKVLEEGSDARALNAEIATSTLPLEAVRPFKAIALGSDNYANALNCLTQAIYYEAATEPVSGQRAVAQVVLNRVRHPAYPNSVCGVVYEGSSKPVCQFSFTCDGSLLRQPSSGLWANARNIAARALQGQVEGRVGTATHYHADYVLPRWAYTLAKVEQIGAHIFYRFPGSAGTALAFSRGWNGREVMPRIDLDFLRARLAADYELEAAAATTPGLTVTPHITDRHAASDVGGRLDTTKQWRLEIPDPVSASETYQTALQRQDNTVQDMDGPIS